MQASYEIISTIHSKGVYSSCLGNRVLPLPLFRRRAVGGLCLPFVKFSCRQIWLAVWHHDAIMFTMWSLIGWDCTMKNLNTMAPKKQIVKGENQCSPPLLRSSRSLKLEVFFQGAFHRPHLCCSCEIFIWSSWGLHCPVLVQFQSTEMWKSWNSSNSEDWELYQELGQYLGAARYYRQTHIMMFQRVFFIKRTDKRLLFWTEEQWCVCVCVKPFPHSQFCCSKYHLHHAAFITWSSTQKYACWSCPRVGGGEQLVWEPRLENCRQGKHFLCSEVELQPLEALFLTKESQSWVASCLLDYRFYNH